MSEHLTPFGLACALLNPNYAREPYDYADEREDTMMTTNELNEIADATPGRMFVTLADLYTPLERVAILRRMARRLDEEANRIQREVIEA